jgi:hypothetical protein
MKSTNPFRPGGKDDALQGSGPRNAVANAGSSETTRQPFTSSLSYTQRSTPNTYSSPRLEIYGIPGAAARQGDAGTIPRWPKPT